MDTLLRAVAQHLSVDQLCFSAWALGRPLALWKLPNSGQLHGVMSTLPPLPLNNVELDELGEGFVVAPFDTGQAAQFIKADYLFRWQLGPQGPHEGTLQAAPHLSASEQQQLLDALHARAAYRPVWHTAQGQAEAASYEAFTQSVGRAVEAIGQGHFQKVVLSRCKYVPLPVGFAPGALLQSLCALYPFAFVSLVSVPGLGTWLGASPETLVSLDAQGIFRTMSLAGTQARGPLDSLQQATWTQKEIEEQALVSRYIINCFKKIRLREFEESGPRTVAAGHLIHLRTDFEVDTRATGFAELPSVMLKLLHPTSAVCGMPKEAALAFIAAHEGYNRQLYSGYLGPVGIGGEHHLFVNLRCLQLLATQALLYAGAGITHDSAPEKEWLETEMKCNTMLKALG